MSEQPTKYVWQECTSGVLDVVSAQKIESLLGEEGQQRDSVPRQFEASFTDGQGRLYKGTLYLVEDGRQGGPQK